MMLVVFSGTEAQQLSAEQLHFGGGSNLTPLWHLHLEMFAGIKVKLTV